MNYTENSPLSIFVVVIKINTLSCTMLLVPTYTHKKKGNSLFTLSAAVSHLFQLPVFPSGIKRKQNTTVLPQHTSPVLHFNNIYLFQFTASNSFSFVLRHLHFLLKKNTTTTTTVTKTKQTGITSAMSASKGNKLPEPPSPLDEDPDPSRVMEKSGS